MRFIEAHFVSMHDSQMQRQKERGREWQERRRRKADMQVERERAKNVKTRVADSRVSFY